MNSLTIVMPFFDEHDALRKHLIEWKDYPHGVSAIVVDDCSVNSPAELLRESPIPVRLYSVLEDIQWNQPGARNLGMLMCSTEWVLSTDIDHILPAATAHKIMQISLTSRAFYTLGRIGAPKPHLNSLLLTREAYWDAGGFDEDFCGNYGYDDTDFRQRLSRIRRLTHLKRIAMRVVKSSVRRKREPKVNRALLKAKGIEAPVGYCRFLWTREEL